MECHIQTTLFLLSVTLFGLTCSLHTEATYGQQGRNPGEVESPKVFAVNPSPGPGVGLSDHGAPAGKPQYDTTHLVAPTITQTSGTPDAKKGDSGGVHHYDITRSGIFPNDDHDTSKSTSFTQSNGGVNQLASGASAATTVTTTGQVPHPLRSGHFGALHSHGPLAPVGLNPFGTMGPGLMYPNGRFNSMNVNGGPLGRWGFGNAHTSLPGVHGTSRILGPYHHRRFDFGTVNQGNFGSQFTAGTPGPNRQTSQGYGALLPNSFGIPAFGGFINQYHNGGLSSNNLFQRGFGVQGTVGNFGPYGYNGWRSSTFYPSGQGRSLWGTPRNLGMYGRYSYPQGGLASASLYRSGGEGSLFSNYQRRFRFPIRQGTIGFGGSYPYIPAPPMSRPGGWFGSTFPVGAVTSGFPNPFFYQRNPGNFLSNYYGRSEYPQNPGFGTFGFDQGTFNEPNVLGSYNALIFGGGQFNPLPNGGILGQGGMRSLYGSGFPSYPTLSHMTGFNPAWTRNQAMPPFTNAMSNFGGVFNYGFPIGNYGRPNGFFGYGIAPSAFPNQFAGQRGNIFDDRMNPQPYGPMPPAGGNSFGDVSSSYGADSFSWL